MVKVNPILGFPIVGSLQDNFVILNRMIKQQTNKRWTRYGEWGRVKHGTAA